MKEINVAMIGAGSVAKPHSIGFMLLPAYYWPLPVMPVRKVICDMREEAAKEAAARYGWEEYATDWREVINRKDIDLVDILVPNEMHAEVAIAAAEAGKMIYCEKPLTTNTKDGQRILDAVKKAGVRTAVGYNKRRFPAVIWAKQLIDEGYIGEPIQFHGSYMGCMSINPDFPYTWRDDVGVFRETGCHIMDLCRYLLGDFERICGFKRTMIKERPRMIGYEINTSKFVGDKNDMVPIKAEDCGSFMILLKNGVPATFDNSFVASGHWDGVAFEVYGTKGAIRFDAKHCCELQISSTSDPANQQGFRTVQMGGVHPHCFWPFAGLGGLNWADQKAIEIYEMLDAFVNDKSFHPDFEDGLKIVEATEALYESAENDNKWINLK